MRLVRVELQVVQVLQEALPPVDETVGMLEVVEGVQPERPVEQAVRVEHLELGLVEVVVEPRWVVQVRLEDEVKSVLFLGRF